MSGQLALLVRAQFHCSVMRLANKQIVPTCVSVVKDVTNFELPCRMALLATAQTNCRSHNRMPIFSSIWQLTVQAGWRGWLRKFGLIWTYTHRWMGNEDDQCCRAHKFTWLSSNRKPDSDGQNRSERSTPSLVS